MTLSQRCRDDFEGHDWSRGRAYFHRGAVLLVGQSSTGVMARVAGSRMLPYTVWLDWSQAAHNQIRVSCTCPRFEDARSCKHIVAAILATEAEQIDVPGNGPLSRKAINADKFRDDDFSPLESGQDEEPDDFGDGLEDEDRGSRGWMSPVAASKKSRPHARAQDTSWRKQLAAIESFVREDQRRRGAPLGRPWTRPRELWYLLDLDQSRRLGLPTIALRQREVKKDGTFGKLKAANLSSDEADNLPNAEDRTLFGLMAGNEIDLQYSYGYSKYCDFVIVPALFEIVIPKLCATGRFGFAASPESKVEDVQHLTWDDGPPWKLRLDVTKIAEQKSWNLNGRLLRGEIACGLDAPLLIFDKGLIVFPSCVARSEIGDGFRWAAMLRQPGALTVPMKHEDELLERLALVPNLPEVEWPEELKWQEERPAPVPQLRICKSPQGWQDQLNCELTFNYGERTAPFGEDPPAWYNRRERLLVHRNLAAERSARDQLLSAGAGPDSYYRHNQPGIFVLSPPRMPRLVQQLTAAGWRIEAEGRLIRRPANFTISVTSGVDWFELDGACDFDGVSASLPELLRALRDGEKFVRLGDGSEGMLPEDWLTRYAGVAGLGQVEGDRLRFLPTQAALLDALLAAQDGNLISVDKQFARLREKLRTFEGIQPSNEPSSFQGELRHYQREGLGWLHFLDEFGFGGCLADDMGLGKTVQVLALLEERRRARAATPKARSKKGQSKKPRKMESVAGQALVVVPRSLVFNWIEEARRFTPELRVLNYTGLDRRASLDRLNEHDLVVTTYGTLRQDITKLREFEFDYAILDEAQAVKNPGSQAAKACRLLRARRRLAMTGTPVENHLGELWSLFEFLNPGMLGRHEKLNGLVAAGNRNRMGNGQPQNGRSAEGQEPAQNLQVLARALRPFLLRRTKEQVLSELPPKMEQTLYCELGASERANYDELKDHYRRSLLERVGSVGINKSKIHVLEALLRLRQAACHPGLLDKSKIDAGSAKLETLLEQLAEVIDGGHKTLVFSQFTSLLAIVRKELDRRKIVYEYLDGRTRDRQSKVERFQADAACPVFLISLKAGGQGLNLTAADYVFILDPWWNPAVEAQAIDRAHRIGQQRHVFAYRIIARDTVEEKILQLQDHKRNLAEAIVSADNAVLRNLTAEDLKLLLS